MYLEASVAGPLGLATPTQFSLPVPSSPASQTPTVDPPPKTPTQDCNEVLAFDKTRAKARYRRGLAYEGLGCYDDALKDLQAVVRTFSRVYYV